MTDATIDATDTPEAGRLEAARQRWASASPFMIASLLIALGLVVVSLYPIARVLHRLVVSDDGINLGLVQDVLREPGLATLIRNTVILVIAAGALAVIAGSTLAWLMVRTNARIGWIGSALPLVPFLLPSIVGVIGWTLLLSPGAGLLNVAIRSALDLLGIHIESGPIDIYTWYGMIGIYALFMTPFTYVLVSAGLSNMDSQLEEQARVSGAGLLRTLRTVTLPAVSANIGAAMLLTIWFGFAFFTGPAVIGPEAGINVLSVRIVNKLTFTYPAETDVAVGLSCFILVAVGIAWYLQSRLLRKARYAVIGGRGKASLVDLGRWKWPARMVIFGYIACALVLPFLVLLWVAIRGYWSSKFELAGLSTTEFRNVLYRDALTRRSIVNSLKLALVGATVAMLAAAVVARYVQTTSSRLGRVTDGLVKASLPVPSIVMAVGFVLAFSGPPFNLGGSSMLLLLAYLAIFLPQATISADAAASQVGVELSEASHISGASGARTFARVSLPLMLPGLVGGWAFLFLWMLGEFNASVMLASTSSPVIGFQIYNFFVQGFYGRLAALSVVLLIINLTIVTLVMAFGRGRSGRIAMRARVGQ